MSAKVPVPRLSKRDPRRRLLLESLENRQLLFAPFSPVLELDVSHGVVQNGGAVDSWQDQSASGVNDVASAGDARPSLLTNATPNGKNAIRFDGVNDRLIRSLSDGALAGLPGGSDNRSMFLVAQFHDTNAYAGAVYGVGAPNEAFGIAVASAPAAPPTAAANRGKELLQGWGSGNDRLSTEKAFDPAGTTNGWRVLTAVLENNVAKLYSGGNQIATFNHTYNTNLSNADILNDDAAFSRFVLGEEIAEAGHVRFDVAAVLVYDTALDAAGRATVESYLTAEFIGVAPSLDAVDDAIGAEQDTPLTIPKATLLANDTFSVADPSVTVSSSNTTQGGSILETPSGFTYTPANGFVGTDSFVYTLSEVIGGVSDTATVTITVVGGDFVTNGLVLRLEGNSAVTTTTATSTVLSWNDISSSGNELVASGDPQLVPAALNGHDIIVFDGVDDMLQDTTLTGLPGGASDRSVFMVAKYDSVGFGGFAYGKPMNNQVFGATVSSNGELRVQGWGLVNDFDSGDAGTGEGWLIQEIVVSSNELSHFRDGVLIDSQTHAFNTAVGAGSKIVLGAEIDGDPQLNMSVAEILVYDRAISPAERTQIELYLHEKYFAVVPPLDAMDDNLQAIADTPLAFPSSVLLGNDVVSGPAMLMLTSTTTTAGGNVQETTPGSFVYMPPSGFVGADSFTYTLGDENGGSDTATVTINVEANIVPLQAVDDTLETMVGTSLEIPETLLLVNDSLGTEPTSITGFVSVTAQGGSITFDGTTTYVYTPATNFVGDDTFTYTITDASNAISTATVTITVVHGAFVAEGLVLQLNGTTVDTTATSTVLGWDDPISGNQLVPSGAPQLIPGVLNGHNVVQFDGVDDLLQDATLAGLPGGASDRSVFLVAKYDSVGYGGFAYGLPSHNRTFGAIVSPSGELMVQGWGTVNDFISDEAGTGQGWLIQEVILSDNQLDHYRDGMLIDTRTHTYNTAVGTGSVIVLGAEIDSTPQLEMSVAEVLVYNRALTSAERLQLELYLQDKYFTGNQAPNAVDDAGEGFVTDADTSFVTLSVLANDSDGDNDPLIVESFSTTLTKGVITSNADGTFNFDPNGEFSDLLIGESETTSFSYMISDGNGGMDEATVNITVNGTALPPNQDPTANDDSGEGFETNAGMSFVTGSVLANDVDPDMGDILIVAGVNYIGLGNLVNNNDGTFIYDPGSVFDDLPIGQTATETFTYTVTDGNGGSDSAMVTITIHGTAIETTGPKLQTGIVDANTEGWTTVQLPQGYDDMVVVTTPVTDKSNGSVVSRIRNASGNSFEIKLQHAGNLGGIDPIALPVHYTVVEAGVYTLEAHGVKMEAIKTLSTVTDYNGQYIGQNQTATLVNDYTNPVVVGQVMTTASNSQWSAFWSRGTVRSASTTNPVSDTSVWVGKHVGSDSEKVRADETIGFIVIEQGAGTINGVSYSAALGSKSIDGVTNNGNSYPLTLENAGTAVASISGIVGADGGWAVLHGDNPLADNAIDLAIEEDQAQDLERGHTNEFVAYIAFMGPPMTNRDPIAGDDDGPGFTTKFDTPFTTANVLANDADADFGDVLNITNLDVSGTQGTVTNLADGTFDYDPGTAFAGLAPGATAIDSFTYTISDGNGGTDTATVTITITKPVFNPGPKLQTGVLPVTTGVWTTVTLPEDYADMVVVTTPVTSTANPSVATRVRNASGNSFEVMLQHAGNLGGNSAVTLPVHYTVVDAGVYNDPETGMKFEAVKVLSNVTDRKGSFVGKNVTGILSNTYATPVVVGQVMSFNDFDWSTFWSRGTTSFDAVSGDAIWVGKQVGSDSNLNREPEQIGFLVFEQGSGVIGDFSYSAVLGASTIDGVANLGNSYPLTISNPLSAIASQSGMHGPDGGWAVLHGNSPLEGVLSLAIEEDQAQDLERNHANEQVAYVLFSELAAPTGNALRSLSQSIATVIQGNDFSLPLDGSLLGHGSSNNTLMITDVDSWLDLSENSIDVRNFNRIDLTDETGMTLALDASVVSRLATATKSIDVVAGEGDHLVIRDAANWRLADPVLVDGQFLLIARSILGGEETIRASLANQWRNFLHAGDVDNSGDITAGDALEIVHELNQRRFSNAVTSELVAPQNVIQWPGLYLDRSGDDLVTALDALLVINDLFVQSFESLEVALQSDILDGVSTDSSWQNTNVDGIISDLITLETSELSDTSSESIDSQQRSIAVGSESSYDASADNDTSSDAVDELLSDAGFMDTLV